MTGRVDRRLSRSMRVLAVSTAVCASLMFAQGSPVTAADIEGPRVFAGPQAKLYGYTTPVVIVEKGEQGVTFTNIDLEKHDVVQDVETDGFGAKKPMPWCKAKKKGKKHGHAHHHGHGDCPLFWSESIGLGDETEILGLKNLESGQVYSFFCTLHHGMKGKLVVE